MDSIVVLDKDNDGKKNVLELDDTENFTLVTTEKDFFRLNKTQRKNIKFLKIKIEIKDKKNLEKIQIKF